MGPDLVNACIFCAGMLLGMDLQPRNGLGAELGFSYATLARRYEIGDVRVDTSDVTPKFLLAGIGWAREAPGGLGAGTPEKEFRLRIGFATSHDEQELKAFPEVEACSERSAAPRLRPTLRRSAWSRSRSCSSRARSGAPARPGMR